MHAHFDSGTCAAAMNLYNAETARVAKDKGFTVERCSKQLHGLCDIISDPGLRKFEHVQTIMNSNPHAQFPRF
jgi:DNA transposition AAA+ family ATPase